MEITSMYDVYLNVKEAIENPDIIDYGFLIRDSVCVFDNSYDLDDLIYVLRFCLSSIETFLHDPDPQKASFFTMLHSFCERYLKLFSSLQLGDQNVL